MAKEKAIRVRLLAYDHVILDESVQKILEVANKTGAGVKGPIPVSYTHLTLPTILLV